MYSRMIKKLTLATILATILFLGCDSSISNRESVSLNGIWDFYPNGDEVRHDILVPSFWDAPQDYDYPMEWLHMMHGIYKTEFTVPASMTHKKIILSLDRISVIAKVFVNGKQVGGEPSGGYLMMLLPYKIDITDIAKIDQPNTLEVWVWGGQQETYGEGVPTHWKEKDFPADALDEGKMLFPWCVDHYDGRRGIVGNVNILAYPKVYIENVFVAPDLNGNGDPADDCITIETTLVNGSDKSRTVDLYQNIKQVKGNGKKSLKTQTVALQPGEIKKVIIEDLWTDAAYWWTYDPQLYTLNTEIKDIEDSKNVLDHLDTRFGFKEFRVNGNYYELNGIRCNLRAESFEFIWHEGYNHGPSAGPVFSTKELTVDVQKELLKAYKSLNLNTLRMHKAGMLEASYNFCDEIGLLVIDEVPFWQTQQRTDERAKDNFNNWVKQWIKLRRNHASIIMWSICNECWTSPIPEFTYHAAKETDPTRPAYHQGVFPNDFQGDEHCIHYSGGYPFKAFNKADLYGVYKNNPNKPKGEGESFCPEGWPVKHADGSINDERRSERGSNIDPDLVSQSQWIQGVCRYVRAMRFAELADARSYMNWVYCFDPIPADIYPKWGDIKDPEIKPVVIHRPVCNAYTDEYPKIIEAKGIEYWRDTHSAVAVFDVRFDKENRLGVPSSIYKNGQQLTRELVVYNDELKNGTNITVDCELILRSPESDIVYSLNKKSFDIDVPYGEKRLTTVSLDIPQSNNSAGWLILKLQARKQNDLKFEEENRLGALNEVPAPKLIIMNNSIDIGRVKAGSKGQLHKITLTNVGGGMSESWKLLGLDDSLVFSRSTGNCRGEEDLYFYIDATDLKVGRKFDKELHFIGESGSRAKINIRFSVN